jgi:hypothetical protein
MLNKKCSNCNEKIERRFKFCPWCGKATRPIKREDYGMLGLDDEIKSQEPMNPLSMFGGSLGNVFSHLTKQLSKELQKLDLGEENGPKGIEIRFSTGKPLQNVVKPLNSSESNISESKISIEELERRKKLPIELAKSKVRRLSEGIIYEIDVPGVNSKQEVSILRMENSLEIKAFSKDKCYLKTIPMKVDILKYTVQNNIILVQIKG